MMNKRINQLLDYGLSHKLMMDEDVDYVLKSILTILKFNEFKRVHVEIDSIFNILNGLADQDDDIKTRLLDSLLGRPSDLYRVFRTYYKRSPQQATNYFYQLSMDSLNVYPDWLEAIQEEKEEAQGFCYSVLKRSPYDNDLKPLLNQRTMSISFNNEKKAWRLTYLYRPWLREQALIFRSVDKGYKDSQERFNEMLNFMNKFPHYYIGPNFYNKNYDGTYMVGRDQWPIEESAVKEYYKSKRVKVDILDWPISVLRLASNNENRLLDKLFLLERAGQRFNKELIMYPLMRLDGSQFNVYVFFIKKDDLEKVNLLKLVGYHCIDACEEETIIENYLSSLKVLNTFNVENKEFISFVRNAI